jgi:hypothetical protein
MTASHIVANVEGPTPSTRENDKDIDPFNLERAQSIPGSSIDPEKLITLLKTKFGAGNYDIHVSAAYIANFITTLVKS